jgi:CRP/FNR family cyclic AMP-dependent transcriptional regulator
MTVTHSLDLERLRSYPLFQDLTTEELRTFLANTTVKDYDPLHSRILVQGEPGNGLGVLLAGKVKIFKTDTSQHEHLLSVLKEGDFFGEMALLEASSRSATVLALEPTTVLWLKADDFHRFIEGATPLIAKILARMVADLSRRLRMLDERYVFMKTHLGGRDRP